MSIYYPCETCCLLEDERDAYRKCLKVAAEALHAIMAKGTTGDGNTPECVLAYEALGKLEQMKYELGEF